MPVWNSALHMAFLFPCNARADARTSPSGGRFIFAPFRCDWFTTQGLPTAVWDCLCVAQRDGGFMNRSDMHLSIIWIWTFPLPWSRDIWRDACLFAPWVLSGRPCAEVGQRRGVVMENVLRWRHLLNSCLVKLSLYVHQAERLLAWRRVCQLDSCNSTSQRRYYSKV